MVVMKVSRDEILERIRHFNRRYLNPFTLSFAGRKGGVYSIVEHVGRRSGQRYATPVVAMRWADGFVMPLPYGIHVDWYRNILAAGGCVVAWQGHAYRTVDPRLIPPEQGLAAFPRWVRRLLQNADTQAYLYLRLAAESPEDPAAYARFIAEHPATDAWRVVVPGLLILAVFVTTLWLTTGRRRGVDLPA